MIVGSTPAYLRTARVGLDARTWAVWGVAPGSPAWRDPSQLADLVYEQAVDVIYTSSISGGGLLVAAAKQFLGRTSPAWLTSISGFDLMTDYQAPEVAEHVPSALKSADGLLPFSPVHATRALELGFWRRVFPMIPLVFEIEIPGFARHPLGSPARRRIVIDGSHGLVDRGLMAIAGVRSIAPELQGYELVVLNADDTAAIAATVLGTDTGVGVTTLTREASTAAAVLGAHERAICSIRLSLDPDVRWFEIAAMSEGALPILGSDSDMPNTAGRDACVERVDPEDPAEIAQGVMRVLAADGQRRAARAQNASIVRERFKSAVSAAGFADAVRSISLGD